MLGYSILLVLPLSSWAPCWCVCQCVNQQNSQELPQEKCVNQENSQEQFSKTVFSIFHQRSGFSLFFFHTKYFFHSLRKTAFFKFLKNAFKLLCFYLVAVIFTRASALLVGKEAGTHIEAYSRFQNSTKSFFIDDGRFWT